MRQVFVIAAKEFREAWRNRIFLVIAGLFLVFSVLSVYIGSSTKHAELQAYAQTVSVLKTAGTSTLPPPPEILPLAILKNDVSYVSMIGALLAIFLGFDQLTKEKEHGNLRLLLSRPVLRDQLITGKVVSGALVIGLLQGLALLFDVALLRGVGGIAPTAGEILRLTAFAAVSFLYLMLFYLVALMASAFSRSAEVVFLACVVFWIGVSFVIPQLAETQRAYAYATNSVAATVTQIPQDTTVSQAMESLSPTVHFEHLGNNLLQVVPETAKSPLGAVLASSRADLVHLAALLLAVLSATYWGFLGSEVSDHA